VDKGARVRNNIHTVLDYDMHELCHNCCSLGRPVLEKHCVR
jgi:hypothetical protein